MSWILVSVRRVRADRRRLTVVGNDTLSDGKVDTSLEDGVLAGVTVDTDPGRGRRGGATGRLGSGNDKFRGHRLVRALYQILISLLGAPGDSSESTDRGRVEHRTGPVGAVLNVGDVALGGTIDLVVGAGLMDTVLATLDTVRQGRTGDGSSSEKNAGEESSEDHFGDERSWWGSWRSGC